jgi:hypothetical protein
VDIDLKIVNTDTMQTVITAMSWGEDEVLAIYLPAAAYNFTISYYGIYEVQFCETFEVEIAIAPDYLYPDFSYCNQPSSFPDFSNVDNALEASNHTFNLPIQTYNFNYSGSFVERTFFTQNFTISGLGLLVTK